MLTQPDHLQAYTAEELSLLTEPLPGTSAFPPSRDQEADVQLLQLAQMGKLSSGVGAVAGRIFGFGRPELPTAYNKLKKLKWEEERRLQKEKGLGDPLEAAAEALDPNIKLDEAASAMTGGALYPHGGVDAATTMPLEDIRILSRTSHPSDMGDMLHGGAPRRIVDDAERHDDYLKSLTMGDEDMDKILADFMANNPRIKDGIIAGIRVVGAKGDAKVPDELHVRALLDSIGAHVEKQLAKKDPKQLATMKLQAMSELGDLLGEDPDKLARNFMGGLQINLDKPGHLAAQMIAGKSLLISELRVLDSISDEVINAPMGVARDGARIAWRRQAEMVAQLQLAFKGTQTEIARAVGALRQPNTTDAQLLSRDLTTIIDDLEGGAEKLDEAIMAYRAAESPADRLELAKALTRKGTKFDALYEVWLNSILSGYFSHVKNIVGGFATLMSDDLEIFGIASYQLVTRSMRGLERDATFGDVSAKMFGQVMSMREALVAGGRAAWYREEPAMLGFGSKLDPRYTGQRPDAFSAAGLQYEGNWPRSLNFMGSVLTMGRAPMRALAAEDAFLKVVAYRGSLWEQAWRSGRQLGLNGDEFSTHVAKFMFAPPAEATIKAQDLAKYVALQTDPEQNFKNLQKFFRGRARWIVPFFKTPLNAILWVGERSPFARRLNRYKTAIQGGGVAAAQAKTRFAMGMATFTALALEYDQDNITGGISSDSRVRAAYARMGITPYSVRFGDNWYNYNVIEPISTILGVVSDAMEIIHHPDTDERTSQEIAIGVAGAIGYNMTNKTYMAGIAKFMDAIRDPKRRLDSFAKQYAGSILLPGSAALNDIRKLNDDLKRWKIDTLDVIRAKLPGFSEYLGIKRDLWGRPIAEHRFKSPYKPNPRDLEIIRLRLPIADHPKNYDEGPDGIEYTVEERDFFHEKAGDLSAKYIDSYMASEGFKHYQKISKATGDSIARDEIKNGFNGEIKTARKDAKQALLDDPELGPGLKERLTERYNERQKKILEYDKRVLEMETGQ